MTPRRFACWQSAAVYATRLQLLDTRAKLAAFLQGRRA